MIKSTDLILIATVTFFSLAVAFTSVGDSVISEISDSTGALQEVDNRHDSSGLSSNSSSAAGSTITNAVGVSALSFDRIGGSFDAEVRTNFSASVLVEQ